MRLRHEHFREGVKAPCTDVFRNTESPAKLERRFCPAQKQSIIRVHFREGGMAMAGSPRFPFHLAGLMPVCLVWILLSQATAATLRIGEHGAHLYLNKDAASEKIATLQPGEEVIPILQIVGQDAWYRVKTREGRVGWLKASEVARVEEERRRNIRECQRIRCSLRFRFNLECPHTRRQIVRRHMDRRYRSRKGHGLRQLDSERRSGPGYFARDLVRQQTGAGMERRVARADRWA